MAIGQLDWRSQAVGSSDAVNNYVVQAALERQKFYEVRDSGVFGDMAVDKSDASGNGMFDANVDVAGTGAVWSASDANSDEHRFMLERIVGGSATYGDAPPAEGDYNAYLFQSVFQNEVDSPKLPIPGRMSQLRIKNMIPDTKEPARRASKAWQIEERDFDCHTALVMGESYGLLLDPAVVPGALGKDMGPGVGVDAPCELLVTATTGAQVTIPSQGPRSTQYRDNVITALAALSASGTKYMTRVSPQEMYYRADEAKIKKVRGADWDYEGIIDGSCLKDLLNSSSDLMKQFQIAQQGQGTANQRSLKNLGGIIVDGIRFIPSKTLEKFRPYGNGTSTGLNAGSPILRYGDGTRDRRNKRFTSSDYKIGLCFILGEAALLELNNGSITDVEIETPDGKGWETFSWTMRGVRRGFWQRRDGEAMTATDGWLQQNVMEFAFNINSASALV